MHLYEGTSCLLPHFTVMEQFHQLRTDLDAQERRTCHVAAGSTQTGNESDLHRIGNCGENNGNRARGRLRGTNRRRGRCCDHGYLPTDQIGCHRRQSIVLNLRPPVLDLGVLAAFVTCLPQPNASTSRASLFGLPAARYPITGIAIRCARAPIGQAAAPPPSALMKSLRLIAPSPQDRTISVEAGALEGARPVRCANEGSARAKSVPSIPINFRAQHFRCGDRE
jgi:hypothetical protein